jgi:hypothetical protein
LVKPLGIQSRSLKVESIVVSWDHRSQAEKNIEAMGSMSLDPKPDKFILSGNIYLIAPASMRIAKTEDGLRGVVRLDQCQNRLGEVECLLAAVWFKCKLETDKLRAKRFVYYHHVDDPYKLTTRFGQIECEEVEAA